MTIKLIVGLQNPGDSYAHTRHNAGAWFVEALVNQCGGSFKPDKKLKGQLAEIKINEMSCKVLLPSLYMNQSGQSVRAVSQFYKIQPDEILVAHDELDLDVGRIKLKTGGGHGGHNGLRDIISLMGTPGFHRLRIGIGHPGHRDLVTPFVLGKPTAEEKNCILEAINQAVDAKSEIISGQMPAAMNKINS